MSAIAARRTTTPSALQPVTTAPMGGQAKGGGPSAGVDMMGPVFTGTVLVAVTAP